MSRVTTFGYDVRNRTYSPTMMRFGQEDPMGYVDGYNDYAYLGGNVNGNLDPGGTQLLGPVSGAPLPPRNPPPPLYDDPPGNYQPPRGGAPSMGDPLGMAKPPKKGPRIGDEDPEDQYRGIDDAQRKLRQNKPNQDEWEGKMPKGSAINRTDKSKNRADNNNNRPKSFWDLIRIPGTEALIEPIGPSPAQSLQAAQNLRDDCQEVGNQAYGALKKHPLPNPLPDILPRPKLK